MVYALKQFRHYLLGRHFQAPLQWLSAQKMEGMLCRWALAIQEYDFHIVYRKGSLNANADALSRTNNTPRAITLATPHPSTTNLRSAQLADLCISKVLQTRAHSELPPQDPDWRQHPLRQYQQLWTQLKVVDGVLCRKYRIWSTLIMYHPFLSLAIKTCTDMSRSVLSVRN